VGESGVVDDPRVTTSDGTCLPWFIDCDAASTTNGAVFSVVTVTVSGGGLARCRRRKKITTTARAITAIPPTAPATMAPVFGLLPPEGEGVVVGFGEVLVAGRAAEELEALINSPGNISGLSPAVIDLLEFQLFSRVISRRAQRGTRMPSGIGLGKLWANYSVNTSNHVSQQEPHVEGGKI